VEEEQYVLAASFVMGICSCHLPGQAARLHLKPRRSQHKPSRETNRNKQFVAFMP
jgi:hypothetical protein